jgi:drug/metabolite transporter (DMT)-like permease
MTSSTRGILYASSAAVMWAILPIFLKIALTKVTPFGIVWYRFVIAFAMLLIWCWFRDRSLFSIFKSIPKILFWAILGLAYNYYGYLMGVQYTSPTVAQIIIQIGPLLFALSGIFFFQEKLKPHQIVGCAFFIVGFLTFYYDQFKNSLMGSENLFRGFLWIGSAALTWAVYAHFQKKLIATYSPQSLNLILYFFCGLIFSPLVSLEDFQLQGWNIWLVIFILGLNTFIAYGAVAEAIKLIPAIQVSLIISLNPILTLIVMGILSNFNVSETLKESIGLTGITGAMFIFFGSYLVNKK